MAQRTLVMLVDDLDGTELEDGKGETVTFGLDGVSYEIDLSDKNAKKLRDALDQYVKAGRKVGGRRSSGRSASRGSSEDLTAVREWARANGYEVSERGRVKQEIKDAYHAANG